MMKKFILPLVFTLLLTGCKSIYVPPVPPLKFDPEMKVGLLVNISDNPKHTHIGTTIFNNDFKGYDHDWQMQAVVTDLFKREIEAATSFTVVELDNPSAAANFVGIADKQWYLNPSAEAARQALLAQGIGVVITITEVPTLAMLNCSQYGCTEFYSQGQGLFTRSFFGIDNYHASASYDFTAEILDPGVDLMIFENMRELVSYDQKNASFSMEDPADFENITEQEFAVVKMQIERYIASVAQQMSRYLNGEFEQRG